MNLKQNFTYTQKIFTHTVLALLISASAVSTGGSEPKNITIQPSSIDVVEPGVVDLDKYKFTSITNTNATSRLLTVDGYASVGVTWNNKQPHDVNDLVLQANINQNGKTRTETLTIEPNAVAEATLGGVRAGSELHFIGQADQVQVQASSISGKIPEGLEISVIDPGEDEVVTKKVDTTTNLTLSASETPPTDWPYNDNVKIPNKPKINSRAAWGADEKMREDNIRYRTVKAAVVHHTVNRNDYTQAQVPGIIRSIYTYHVKSQGWSDIGYNFLVDRFGGIWEGRAGGTQYPVRGAHIAAYNDEAFGVSAIGNYDIAKPSTALVNSMTHLIAWKLSMHGVDANTRVKLQDGKTFNTIFGHKDGGQTACPGRYLYPLLGNMRINAKKIQNAGQKPPPRWQNLAITGKITNTNHVDTPALDLLARNKKTNKIAVIATGGGIKFNPKANMIKIGAGGGETRQMVISQTVDSNYRPDIIRVDVQGRTWVHSGTGGTGFSKGTLVDNSLLKNATTLIALGDINKDGYGEILARTANKNIVILHGSATGKFRVEKIANSWNAWPRIAPYTYNGQPHLLLMGSDKKLARVGFNIKDGKTTTTAPVTLGGDYSAYTHMDASADYNDDGYTDLILRKNDGKIYIQYGNASGSFGVLTGAGATTNGPISTYSITGSKHPDIVSLQNAKVAVWEHNGKYDIKQPQDTNIDATNLAEIYNVGDFNKDGQNDMVVKRNDNTWWLHTRKSNLTYNSPVLLRGIDANAQGVKNVGDVTGDGLPDMVGKVGGTVYVWAGNKTSYKTKITADPRLYNFYHYTNQATSSFNSIASTSVWDYGTGHYAVAHRKNDGHLRLWRRDGNAKLNYDRSLGIINPNEYDMVS